MPDDARISLVSSSEWSYLGLRRAYDAIEAVAIHEFGLDLYPNRIEIITAEQMLDAYSSIGMPLMYRHWSFGKRFARDEAMYRKGQRGLAYEIVINSSPCISYIMEENSMAMQFLVMAHAAFGHNHFFKTNSLFRQWTDADGILDYMEFAQNYIQRCEHRYGHAAVEALLDAAHAIMDHGVHRYPPKRRPNLRDEEKRERERAEHQQAIFNDLWRTLPKSNSKLGAGDALDAQRRLLRLPEENMLYFFEKTAPKLAPWQREILRIVRNIAQYFYPQKQTKVMNEGCATYVHYEIINRLYASGRVSEGAMLELLHSHTSVVNQPSFDNPRYGGINPYALGFSMMRDIARICTEPTEEDRQWFPQFAGNGDPWGTLKRGWAEYRDESFILQFLSPHLIRKLRLFSIRDDANDSQVEVKAIHDEHGYREVRRELARAHDLAEIEPDLQIVDVDLAGDRRLVLHHRVLDGVLLEEDEAKRVLRCIANLWCYPVRLIEIDAKTDATLFEYPDIAPDAPLA
jgi:stage V sporulation protein R